LTVQDEEVVIVYAGPNGTLARVLELVGYHHFRSPRGEFNRLPITIALTGGLIRDILREFNHVVRLPHLPCAGINNFVEVKTVVSTAVARFAKHALHAFAVILHALSFCK